jgi:post-segregation antitoxin (ccd killing protein)
VTAAIRIEVGPGELIDKLTILEIKQARIGDPAKRANVTTELDSLRRTRDQSIAPSPALDALAAELKRINQALWDIEDDIRACERAQDFGPRFIALARAVYHQNDQRAATKRRINELLSSTIVEEKSYESY